MVESNHQIIANSLYITLPVVYTDLEIKDSCLVSNHKNLEPIVIPLFAEVGYYWQIKSINNGNINIVKLKIDDTDFKVNKTITETTPFETTPFETTPFETTSSIGQALLNQSEKAIPTPTIIHQNYDKNYDIIYVKSMKFVINFGKYSGSSVEEILANNPQYIIWLHENKIRNLKFSNNIITEAENEILLRKKH